jgi:hypothetical protein
VPRPLRTRRPAPDRWSVAEVVEHLSLVEAQVAPVVIGALADARAAGVGAERETSSVLPRLDVARLRDRSQPIAAREASQPRAGRDADAATAALDQHRTALRQAVIAADGLALGDVRRPHPRLGDIDIYQWLLFLGAHESRHAEQVCEIGASLQEG